jgi:tRNA-2-methylthio-N6-dimethylallyladenosine synthase
MKVYLETFGCQMNRLDSELVLGSLRADGHEITDDRREADVVLYNTCSVRQHAEQKVRSRIGADAQRRAAGRRQIVGVLGCMAQRLGEKLRREHPNLDIVCGPGHIFALGDMITRAAAGRSVEALDPTRKQARDASSEAAMDAFDLSRSVEGSTAAQAFVRIARGCDNFCSYCIVPFVRGPERSRKPEEIVREVRRLVGAGRSEITLLGQTVNRYRHVNAQATTRFSDLLERVASVPALRRLRFVTSHPSDFTDDVLEAMRDLPNVCEYIHCPAQSGSNTILERMNRGYTREEYDDFVDRARAIVPGVVLAGDFIVGFPGERDADHAASADLIRRSGYKNSFVFKYSPRPGTRAAKTLSDDVPTDVKKQRNQELLAVQEEVGLTHHRGYVGQTVEVLVEGPSPRAAKQQRKLPDGWTQLIGRTRGDHIAVFDGPTERTGHYMNVTVEDANSLTLFARIA